MRQAASGQWRSASMPTHRLQDFVVRKAVTAGEFMQARALFTAYADSVNKPECFVGFEQELSSLACTYSPPSGELFLAFNGPVPVGCCAFKARPDTDHANACEMKRLYVVPAFRSCGLGHQLVTATLDAARVCGYSCMLLDTLSEMESARALYDEMGFTEVAPYARTPIPGAHHLKAML